MCLILVTVKEGILSEMCYRCVLKDYRCVLKFCLFCVISQSSRGITTDTVTTQRHKRMAAVSADLCNMTGYRGTKMRDINVRVWCVQVLRSRSRLVFYLPELHTLVHRMSSVRSFAAPGASGCDESHIAMVPPDKGIWYTVVFDIVKCVFIWSYVGFSGV